MKLEASVRQEFPRASIVKATIPAVHFVIFLGLVVTLLLVQPLPVDPLGYFSFELLTPFWFWAMVAALAVTSVLLIESNNPLALPAIVVGMLAMRLPLFLLFKLPYHPDSYLYMGFVQEWRSSGTIHLSMDLRTQFWPVFFLFLYAITQLGVSELILWSLGTSVLYAVNALLIYWVLRRFVNQKTAKYALLVISAAPTFNFYYYLIMAPQLLASSVFLTALLALFAYERLPSKKRLSIFIGLFALLLFTHHLTALILVGYVFTLLFENPLAWFLRKFGVTSLAHPNPRGNRWKPLLLGTGMFLTWAGYLATVAQEFVQKFLSIVVQAVAGKIGTYAPTTSPSGYVLETYAFNLSSVLLYGFRLLPVAVSALLILILWVRETQKTLLTSILSPEKLRALTATLSFGSLMLVSAILLKGLFLEIPRIFDLVVLFSSIFSATWFIPKKNSKFTLVARGSILLAIMIISSTLGIAIQSSEFVYYTQERLAVQYISGSYPAAILYTDERLVTFARFFAPNLDVRTVPQTLSSMLPNQTSILIFVLISHHSIAYDRYRPVFGHPPLLVLQFVQGNGIIVYSDNGISVYYLR